MEPRPAGAGWRLIEKRWLEDNPVPHALFRRERVNREGYCGLVVKRTSTVAKPGDAPCSSIAHGLYGFSHGGVAARRFSRNRGMIDGRVTSAGRPFGNDCGSISNAACGVIRFGRRSTAAMGWRHD